ncbi:DUF4190 domain-containing protein [Luteolibacter pohnpeiensis]|uniref:DUF4190 domain-containing protein n=1 Tax=Luteolibacter pohnpeiensis TaxID=454153 RepID=A0A934S9V4_9BACT|nr:DUF4190 domain-containing protein [Luteolibacter pohnpeiensis]
MAQKEISPLAIAALAFSCLGALASAPYAILGVVCGFVAKSQAQKGKCSGGALAQSGIVVGFAVLAICLVKWLLDPPPLRWCITHKVGKYGPALRIIDWVGCCMDFISYVRIAPGFPEESLWVLSALPY